MFDYFTYYSPLVSGVQHPIIWPYVRRMMRQNIATTIDYYRKHVFVVKSDHLLVRLLNSVPTPPTQSPYNYIDDIALNAVSMTSMLGWTGPYNVGRVFKGLFFGAGSTELLISVNESFNPNHDEAQWWNVQAIKVLRSPKSDLALMLANGQTYSTQTGLSIFQIDIPRLALQYRSYKKWCSANDYAGTTTQFVARFVIPNILYSQLDNAIIKRLMRLHYGQNDYTDVSFKYHPFNLANHTAHVDRGISKMLGNIRLAKADFDAMLECMDLITLTNAGEFLKIPEVSLTRQINWALQLARIDEVLFLIDLGQVKSSAANRHDIYQMAKSIKSDSTIEIMQEVLPSDLFFEEKAKFSKLLGYL